MDPQQRLVLECVHMAMEEGGITRRELDGSKTGVYIGKNFKENHENVVLILIPLLNSFLAIVTYVLHISVVICIRFQIIYYMPNSEI